MSKEQVQEAVKKGYCEFKNGEQRHFKHVNPHSWFVYYSPGLKPLHVIREKGKEAGKTLRTFTAIGQVLPGEPYSIDLGNNNIVYRRKARYVPNSSDAPLEPLMKELSFLKNSPSRKPWGFAFRKGLIEVLKSDFFKLCEAMNIAMPKRHHLIFEQSNVNINVPKSEKELHRLQSDAMTESIDHNTNVDSIDEETAKLYQTEANDKEANVDEIQKHQEINETKRDPLINDIQQLRLNDASDACENQETTIDDANECVDPIPDGIEETKAFILQHQPENCKDDKENKPIIDDSQPKDFQVSVNGQ
jgi:hypothetical protein